MKLEKGVLTIPVNSSFILAQLNYRELSSGSSLSLTSNNIEFSNGRFEVPISGKAYKIELIIDGDSTECVVFDISYLDKVADRFGVDIANALIYMSDTDCETLSRLYTYTLDKVGCDGCL